MINSEMKGQLLEDSILKTKRFLNGAWGRENLERRNDMKGQLIEALMNLNLERAKNLPESEKETVINFMELLEEDREAFIRSAYMTGLYMHLEKLQWAIMNDKEWKGGKRAIAYIKIQNMMNMSHAMISPEYEYLLEDELAEWTEERRKREEI